jgi:hypothetical protein
MKAKLERWRLANRKTNHIKVTALWLYPELDCSTCIDDCDSGDDRPKR